MKCMSDTAALSSVDEVPIGSRAPMDYYSCGTPNCACRLLLVRSSCHPDATFYVYYDKVRGALLLTCAECGNALGYRLATDG